LEVIRGIALFRQKHGYAPTILFVGSQNTAYYKRIMMEVALLGLQDTARCMGFLKYEQLPALYRSAKLVVFASSCENCPNILLEAMACGKPILCSNAPPMPEFLREGGLYFDPESPQDFCNKLGTLFKDASLRQELSERAHAESLNYSWEGTLARTVGVFHSIVGGNG